jgi:DNA topoisomerase-1
MNKYMDNYIIRKIKDNKKYEYYDINNEKINNINILNKLYKIYIPPAYKNVKIYLDKDLLATGMNNAGRTQYIYSDGHKKKREIKKYNNLIKLSKNILDVKKKINNDLLLKKFTKNKIIALILKIMDLCNFRGGNKLYEKKYGSYGLTTLHKKHILFKKNEVEIDFIGKKGVKNNCIIKNETIQNIIKKVYNLSSKEDPYVFSIIYHNKNISVSMFDINKYLENFNITCKDLRTWNANIIFLKNIAKEFEILDKSYFNIDDKKKYKIKKKLVREAIKKTAISLHHTPTICKNSYIYKKIIENIENSDVIIKNVTRKNIVYENILKKILKYK